MKKQFVVKAAIACAAVVLCGMFAACEPQKTKEGVKVEESGSASTSDTGAQSTAEQPDIVTIDRKYAKEFDLDQYIVLKDYSEFRVARAAVEISDEDVNSILDELYLNSFPSELGIKDRAVALGDSVKIDYCGKKDGVAFDGGTAEDATLTIGSGQFIDGFEDGLIGVNPGETVDLTLTFPENYGSEELNGQTVIFTVTVNSIIPEEKFDEAVQGIIPEVDTVEGLRQYIYDYLVLYEQSQNQDAYEEEIMDTFLEKYVEFKEIPQEWSDYYYHQVRNYFITTAFQYGMNPDELVQNYYGGTDLETFATDYADLATRRDMAMQAVARKENVILQSDSELEDMLSRIASDAGYDTIESYLDYLGGVTREDFRQDYDYEQGFTFIIELASQE
ncbi:MAG: FKBP-type peptidyl-prolyl cis-trans isomerase [Lachnospiraceae bacterium]|nr:FKBP-type peptidyl-prolyl cis-trans isomerase [Lachnospiraceae bacterium]